MTTGLRMLIPAPCTILAHFLICCLPLTTLLGAEQPLTIAKNGHHQVTLNTPTDSVWEITTTGGDPFILTVPTLTPANLAATPMLAFDYMCVSGLNVIEVFAGPGFSAERHVAAGNLPAREGWSPFAVDVTSSPGIAASKSTEWRVDLGTQANKVIQIRNLRLRARTTEELTILAKAQEKLAQDYAWNVALKEYLAKNFLGTLTRIVANANNLVLSGTTSLTDNVRVAEWPIWQPTSANMTFATTWPVMNGNINLTIPRLAEDGSDRALSRFVLIQRHGAQDVLLSHGRWVDVIPAATTLPAGVQRSKKGIGGFHLNQALSDLDELNIGSVTVNVVLSAFFQASPGDGAEAVTTGGHTWYVRQKAFDGLDAIMIEAAKRKLVVLGIILVPPASSWGAKDFGAVMQHPDYYSAGVFTMPNLTTAESTAAYTLALDLLAKRYSRADGKYGRMHHWIMHNEVDMGFVWTNCGKRPELVFFEQYYRSMRLAHAILRRQDPNAQVFISLTHHWAKTGDPETCFPSLHLLNHLLAFCKAEGDFDWGLAYHPYPSSLLEPKTWLDQDAEFRLDTPKITFRNIEVLDAWARQPTTMFQHTKMRSIHLSEQGPNSRDYSDKSLTEQAAAMAYVWKKIAKLDSIQGFEYHNWIDNRGEGGLRIGLRRFADDAEKPMGTKPVWEAYKALGTPDEDRACAFALSVIGITDWSTVPYRGPIPATK